MNLNENRVREYAYQIWESEGRPHGQHQRHWEMACKLAASQAADTQPLSAGTGAGVIDAQVPNGADAQATASLKKSRGKKPSTGTDSKAVKKAAETKSTVAKTTRQKKAKVVNDTLETQLTPIADGFKGSV